MVVPEVRLTSDPYRPPLLQYSPLHCGSQSGGELLAAFELLQVAEFGEQNLPALEEQEGGSFTVPANIRPVLSTYRLEVRLRCNVSATDSLTQFQSSLMVLSYWSSANEGPCLPGVILGSEGAEEGPVLVSGPATGTQDAVHLHLHWIPHSRSSRPAACHIILTFTLPMKMMIPSVSPRSSSTAQGRPCAPPSFRSTSPTPTSPRWLTPLSW